MNPILNNLRLIVIRLRQGIFDTMLASVLLLGMSYSGSAVARNGLDIMAIEANTLILGTPFSYQDTLLGASDGKVVAGFDFVSLDLITETVNFRTVFECLQIVGKTSIERWHTADSSDPIAMPNNTPGMGSVTAPNSALGLFGAPPPPAGVRPCSIADRQATLLNPALAPYVTQLKLNGTVIVIDGAKPNY